LETDGPFETSARAGQGGLGRGPAAGEEARHYGEGKQREIRFHAKLVT
jgi:hypothetical protein